MDASPRTALVPLAAAAALLLVPGVAEAAYGGPGSIISGVGALIAAGAALLAALFGFLWFPLKRLYQKFRGDDGPGEVTEGDAVEPS